MAGGMLETLKRRPVPVGGSIDTEASREVLALVVKEETGTGLVMVMLMKTEVQMIGKKVRMTVAVTLMTTLKRVPLRAMATLKDHWALGAGWMPDHFWVTLNPL